MRLNELEVGKTAVVTSVGGEGALRQHFLDMGILPGARLKLVRYAPMGDPMELRIHSYELSLRLADAANIGVAVCAGDDEEESPVGEHWTPVERVRGHHIEHPGLGEGGKYHDSESETPLPEGETLTFALAGNQNCGKTTLFNQLTGANQHVGNFPGVTVDRKDGKIKKHPETLVTDLPGIYSMSPYTNEEIVSRQFILHEKPKCIINIVDCTNIERNLYLTMQLLELDTPMVVALNFLDEVVDNGGAVHLNELEAALGVPVVAVNALTGEGVDELVDHAIHIARYQERPPRRDFCDENDHGGAVHRALHAVMHLIEDHAAAADIPLRFAAHKLIEGDQRVEDALGLDQNEKETIQHIVEQMEKERGLDRSAAIADMRFEFIRKVCRVSVVKPKESKEYNRSQKVDNVLTGKWTALPCFVAVMAVVFWLTFNVVGPWLQDLLQLGIDKLAELTSQAMQAGHVSPVIQSLIIDGIFNGVGAVVSFLPIICLLFFFLSVLEDSGYMARIAFVMDRPLRRIGLSGRSIVPMLMGFGCTVPGVMAARTLPSERDRKITILMTPFMSCGAKIPIYAFFTAAFFPGKGAVVMTLLYFLGIVLGILFAVVSRKTMYKGEPVPFVMELPNYRMPGPKNVARLLWEKAKDFLQRAFTIIFLCTIIIWFLQTFSFHLSVVTDERESMLAAIAGILVPVLKPLGFGDWRISTALIAGVLAKESVVSTISMLFGSTEGLSGVLTSLGAASLLVFCLIYTPCAAAIASIRRELGGKTAAGVAIWQCAIAWVVSFLVVLVGRLAGLPL
ncbi:MAG: ferrous iron transport protein B [Eubacteriales bacterium]|nr:ferrous iron transport protein B [Eubacteriales bacterium]